LAASNWQRMAQPPKHQHRKRPWLVRFLRGHWRLWSCSVVLLPAEGLPVPRFLFAWDASVILYIGLIYWMIYHSAAGHIRQRSADQDEGQELALGLSISAVIVSLSLVVVWLSATPKGSHADLGLGLAALTSRCHGSSFKRSSRCIARTNIIQSAADVEAGCIFPATAIRTIGTSSISPSASAWQRKSPTSPSSARGSAGSSPSAAFQRDHDRAHGEHRGAMQPPTIRRRVRRRL